MSEVKATEKKEPTTYQAVDEYNKTLRLQSSGNVPVDVVRRANRIALDMVALDPQVRKARHPGFSQRVQNWPQYSTEQKYQFVQECKDLEELRAFILCETDGNDNDLLEFMTSAKRKLEAEG